MDEGKAVMGDMVDDSDAVVAGGWRLLVGGVVSTLLLWWVLLRAGESRSSMLWWAGLVPAFFAAGLVVSRAVSQPTRASDGGRQHG